jgi:hypothetical protein
MKMPRRIHPAIQDRFASIDRCSPRLAISLNLAAGAPPYFYQSVRWHLGQIMCEQLDNVFSLAPGRVGHLTHTLYEMHEDTSEYAKAKIRHK